MDFEKYRHEMIPKRYLVTHFLVVYENDNKKEMEILVPNLHGRILTRHEIKELALIFIKKNTSCSNPKFKSHEKHGKCIFCLEFKKLERSHVIGNTVFKSLFKTCENGQAMRITLREDERKKIRLDSCGWSIEMLCTICESMFNTKFEDYTIKVLRGKDKKVTINKLQSGISFKGVDQKRIMLYVLSLLWRAAFSVVKAYDSVKINYGIDSYLKNCISGNIKVLPKAYSVRIRKLYDELNILNDDSVNQLIVNPFIINKNGNVIYSIIFEGYIFEIFLIAPSLKNRQKRGFLHHKNNILFVPFVDVFSIEGLPHFFAKAREIYKNPSKE